MRKSSNPKTPRPYLSWSAFDLFRRNKEEFRQRYFYGKQGFQSEKMEFGKAFASAMEVGAETGNLDVDFPAQFMPKYPKREHEMRVEIEDPKSGQTIVLLGKFDGYDPDRDPPIIGEYKTGTSKWSKGRVDQNDQLTWYAMVHLKATGKMPVLWLHAYHNEKKTIESFATARTTIEVMAMMGKAISVWREIVKMAEEEYSKI